MQGYVRLARYGLSEADLRQEPQSAACRRGTGPVFLGDMVSSREKLAGPDHALAEQVAASSVAAMVRLIRQVSCAVVPSTAPPWHGRLRPAGRRQAPPGIAPAPRRCVVAPQRPSGT